MMPAAAVLLLFLIVLGVTLPFIRSAEHEVLTEEVRPGAGLLGGG